MFFECLAQELLPSKFSVANKKYEDLRGARNRPLGLRRGKLMIIYKYKFSMINPVSESVIYSGNYNPASDSKINHCKM
jgi:hypothetical protein